MIQTTTSLLFFNKKNTKVVFTNFYNLIKKYKMFEVMILSTIFYFF